MNKLNDESCLLKQMICVLVLSEYICGLDRVQTLTVLGKVECGNDEASESVKSCRGTHNSNVDIIKSKRVRESI